MIALQRPPPALSYVSSKWTFPICFESFLLGLGFHVPHHLGGLLQFLNLLFRLQFLLLGIIFLAASDQGREGAVRSLIPSTIASAFLTAASHSWLLFNVWRTRRRRSFSQVPLPKQICPILHLGLFSLCLDAGLSICGQFHPVGVKPL